MQLKNKISIIIIVNMDFVLNIKRYLSDDFVKELIEALDKEKTNSLILNTKKITNQKFIEKFPKVIPHPFLENVYYYSKKDYEFGKSFLFDNGAYYIMDASSLLVSKYLEIEDGDNVLDMCAAPGGKSISLCLENLDKNFEIIANDISYKRSLELSKNIEHLGLSNVIVTSNNLSQIYKNYKEKFNKIILDAPCSGSAMFRKNDLAKSDWAIEKVNACALLQKELLEEAIYMLEDGGLISYSTCSFSYEENEEVILSVIQNHPEISLVKIEENPKFYRTKELPEAIHLFPNLYDGEGQFICILKKRESNIKNKKLNSKTVFKNEFEKSILKNDFEKVNLNFKFQKSINNTIYLYNNELDLKHFNVIRCGLEIGSTNKKLFIPSFHLAHFLYSENSIAIDENEMKKYIHGEEIKKDLNLEKGFYVVSFEGINLGFVKYSNGVLKNYYPKGLRH